MPISPSLDPISLRHFLSGDTEVSAILNTPISTASSDGQRTWSSDIWSGVQQIYYFAMGHFLTMCSVVLQAVCMVDLSTRLWVDSRHVLSSGTAIKTERVFQENLLAKSINTHRKDSASYFLQAPVVTTLRTNPPESLQFFHKEGICRGMCHWFIYLYLKLNGRIADSDQLMRALGKQFEEGAPNQAAFLHALDFPLLLELLNLRLQPDFSKISVADKTQEQIIHSIMDHPPGIYGIYTSDHQLVYIKQDPTTHYLFDPNKGVLKVNDPDLFKWAMQPYFKTHDRTKKILLDLYLN